MQEIRDRRGLGPQTEQIENADRLEKPLMTRPEATTKRSRRRLRPAKSRQDKTLKTIAVLEAKLPIIKRLSRSEKYGKWTPTVVALLGAFIPLLLTVLLNMISWPAFDIPLPHVDLPSIPLPDINLPDLPDWMGDVMFWLQKTWPIWIAAGFLYFSRRASRASR